MLARPANTGLPAITVSTDSAVVTPSPAHVATVVPNISQPNCDRWTELPVDVAVQVMFWSMCNVGSARSAMSFALTSTYFAQAGQSFLAGPWYQDAQSVLMRDCSLSWTRTYVQLLGYRPLVLAPQDLGELNAALDFVGKGDEGMLHLLDIDHRQTVASDIDHLLGYRQYCGTTLSLLTGVRKEADEQLVAIARALPPKVCLYVEFRYQLIRRRFDHVGVAGLIGRIAASGRPTGFHLKWHAGLPVRPAELGAVLDVACGRGMVSFFNVGSLDDPDAMLRALCDRCHRFRDLHLVMFGCDRPPLRESLVALVAALEKRRSAGQSRLTVVVACPALRTVDASSASMFSAEQRAGFERAGLYIECLESEEFDDRAELKVLASVSGKPVRVMLPQPLKQASEPSSDSDVPTDDSDDSDDGDDGDHTPDAPGGEAQAGPAGDSSARSADEP